MGKKGKKEVGQKRSRPGSNRGYQNIEEKSKSGVITTTWKFISLSYKYGELENIHYATDINR
jgi:hypothetical protein